MKGSKRGAGILDGAIQRRQKRRQLTYEIERDEKREVRTSV